MQASIRLVARNGPHPKTTLPGLAGWCGLKAHLLMTTEFYQIQSYKGAAFKRNTAYESVRFPTPN